MKSNTLQLRRALSAALFVLLLSVVGTKNALAQNQVATLQHEGDISVFFGENALANAHEAAANGDTITLSSGNFNGCTLSKAVTIHGAGCVEDTIAGFEPTIVSSAVGLAVDNDTVPFMIEGVYFNTEIHTLAFCKNISFTKCNINFLNMDYYYWNQSTGTHPIIGLNIVNCLIKDGKFYGSAATIVNSVVKLTLHNQNNQNNINTIYNSVIVCNDNIHLNNSSITNSIIATAANNSVTNTTFHNCIGIQMVDSSLFVGQLNTTNMTVDSYDDVFETFAGEVTYDNIYQLKDEIVNTFLGNDGTEVGIYGGMRPYNTRPPYMIIKTINVAGRTTEDDKLSVEIELNNGD